MNFVFVHIPKTGGYTIAEALQLAKCRSRSRIKKNAYQKLPTHARITFGHNRYDHLLKNGHINRQFDQEAFKFTFVRNPYDRIVSIWKFYKERGHHKKENEWLVDLSFLEFIGKTKRMWQVNPQVYWTDNVHLNFIGRFENFENDLGVLADLMEIELGTIPQLNKTTHNHYSTYYCEHSRKMVESYYKADFEAFGYAYMDGTSDGNEQAQQSIPSGSLSRMAVAETRRTAN
jgi:hypothetical protein